MTLGFRGATRLRDRADRAGPVGERSGWLLEIPA
jgi:hypothetical protein